MTMMMKIILLSFLSAINIEYASSYTLNNKYTNSGFYQGHHKIEPNPQEPAVIPMPVHNIKYTNSGFYQGDSKIKIEPNPQEPAVIPMPVHNIKYTNSGFYQGDSKIKSKIEPKPNPQQPTLLPDPTLLKKPVQNIKYTNSGFYQGQSKIEVWPGVAWCETPPQSHENKAKYMTSGFYQGLKSVPALPLTSRQPDTSSVLYEGFDNKFEKKKKSSDLSDDEIYMLDEVEKFFENDVKIALLLKLIKKMALL